ncbi:hypothetical protein [Micromonospora chersina]|uniref:zinc finger domain-containing protein n=1 Tax=Micromonospora chersina TaxID=47854 RepID=UPI00371535E7
MLAGREDQKRGIAAVLLVGAGAASLPAAGVVLNFAGRHGGYIHLHFRSRAGGSTSSPDAGPEGDGSRPHTGGHEGCRQPAGFIYSGAGSRHGMSSDPGATARQQLERAREAVQKIHQAAVRHRDAGLHELADDISEVALALGHDAGPVQEWRACPVCGAEPGSNCILKPGHEMANGMHPERTNL